MKQFIFFFFLAMISITGCSKKITTTDHKLMSEKIALAVLGNHNFNYQFYSSKANINISTQNFTLGVGAAIRVEDKGDLWLVAKKFGFELGRALVSKDTVKLIDRFNKKYAIQPVSNLEKTTSMENLLGFIQNYIVGNIVIPDSKNKTIDINETSTIIEIEDGKNYHFKINNIDKRLSEMSVLDGTNKLHIKYLSYALIDGIEVPNKYQITAFEDGNEVLTLDIKLSKIDLNSAKSMPFNIPNNYQPFDL